MSYKKIFMVCFLVGSMALYCQAGTVSCIHSGRVFKCAADDCAAVSLVRSEHDYSCDCYVIGKPSTDGYSKSPKWYRLNLPNGQHGYVNSFYCEGGVARCPLG